jgi:ParB family transcriptional regulator, chromosome partitioning protein
MSDFIREIPLEQIQPHPSNRRVGGFDPEKLKQLAESIKAIGVQQPAVVREITGENQIRRYELVAGERRWRASKLAGKETLPCVVRELDDAQALRIQIVENLQREDVHPLDEANGYARLLDSGTYDVEAAASCGRARSCSHDAGRWPADITTSRGPTRQIAGRSRRSEAVEHVGSCGLTRSDN